MEGIPDPYGNGADQSSNQIYELQNEIEALNAQIMEKDNLIYQLRYENSQLKSKIQQLEQTPTATNVYSNPITPPPTRIPQMTPPPRTSTPSPPLNANLTLNPPPSANHQLNPPNSVTTSSATNKRKCPVCGAMGFAIKEFDDKSKIISYVPRRIYHKKKVCTKCMHEF